MDYVGLLMDYESGKLNEEETIILFQKLLDNGMVWQLQGHYGQTAQRMIAEGLIHVGYSALIEDDNEK